MNKRDTTGTLIKMNIPPLKRIYLFLRNRYGNSTVVLELLEEGKLLQPILFSLACIIILWILVSGIDFSHNTVTTVYTTDKAKEYHVKKVSQIPKEKEKEEQEKLSVEEENLTKEEIIKRYYQYVVQKIETNKIYPADEQRKGHEGSVLLKIMINRAGKIEKVVILEQPRYMKLTRAAIKAIRSALPFKPYSKLIEENMLVLKLEINFFLQ